MYQLSTKKLDNDDLAKLQPSPKKSFLPLSTPLPGVPEEVVCSNCGSGFLNDLRFCRKCGQPRASQAALVSVPRRDLQRKGPSFASAPAQVPMIPDAPPRLIARLQELELESLLALCERLEGRLAVPKTSKMVKASDQELDSLCESLSDGKPLTPQQQHHQQQLQYLHHLREARQNAVALPPTSTTKASSRSPGPTEVPSGPRLSPEASPQALSAPASVLDALLIELNDLLEKVPAVQIDAKPESEPCSPARSPSPGGPGPKRQVGANSAGPLPDEHSQLAIAAVRAALGVEVEGHEPPPPTQAAQAPQAPQVPASFTEAVRTLQDALQHLEYLFSDEVAQATEDLRAENSGLVKELEELRARKEPAVTPVEWDAPSKQVEAEEAEVCSSFPPRAEIVIEEEPAVYSAAIRFDGPQLSPPCPDCTPPDSAAFSLCVVWQEELQPGQADWGEDVVDFAPTKQSCWKMHEFSRSRMLWDLLGLLLLLYDAFATPWQLAFGELNSAEVMAWVLPLYWAANIFLTCFCTNFSAGGVLETKTKAMISRYVLHGFFILDSISTSLDILLLSVRYEFSGAGYQAVQSVVQSKDILLGIQIVRLLRTLRINRNSVGLRARVSESWRALNSLVVSVIFVVIGAHIIACALFYLGSATGGNADTWLEEHAQTQQQQDNISMYFVALLWALAQVTPGLGPSPVNPRSLQDLVFSNVVHALALAACLVLLFQVAGATLRLRELHGDWPRRQMTCRAYLAEGPRPAKPLRHHLWSWLDSEPEARVLRRALGWRGPRSLRQNPAEGSDRSSSEHALHALPPQLQQELMGHVAVPLLKLHPFFHELDVAHPQAIKEVVNCLHQLFYSPMQAIFLASTIADSMRFLAKGDAIYLKEPSLEATKRIKSEVQVTVGQHVAEAGLWLAAWSHRGTLAATGVADGCCEVLSLDSHSFGNLLRKGPYELWQAASSYAKAFARRGEALTDLDLDRDALIKITDEAFADALRYLEAGRDTSEGVGPVSP